MDYKQETEQAQDSLRAHTIMLNELPCMLPMRICARVVCERTLEAQGCSISQDKYRVQPAGTQLKMLVGMIVHEAVRSKGYRMAMESHDLLKNIISYQLCTNTYERLTCKTHKQCRAGGESTWAVSK